MLFELNSVMQLVLGFFWRERGREEEESSGIRDERDYCTVGGTVFEQKECRCTSHSSADSMQASQTETVEERLSKQENSTWFFFQK